MKNRILYLSAFNTPEAGNRVLMSWLGWLAREGYFVSVAFPGGGWLADNLCKLKKIKFIKIDYSIPSYKTFFKTFFNIIKLIFFIKKNKIDIIHCNSESAYYIGVRAAKISRVPIVTHFRFTFPLKFYIWLFDRWRKPDGVFYVSNAFYNEEIEKLKSVVPTVRAWPLHNCYNPEDYAFYPVTKKEKTADRRKFIGFYPASIQKRKNQHQLYELAEYLLNLGIDVRIISAGRIDDETYWEECQKNQQRKTNINVEFIGHVDNVLDFYKISDFSISLSSYETFGFSVLESMAAGVPVVGYRDPAVEEVVGNSGFLVSIGDVEGVANSIFHLLDSRELYISAGHKAKERAREMFSVDKIVPELLGYYRIVLGSDSQIRKL